MEEQKKSPETEVTPNPETSSTPQSTPQPEAQSEAQPEVKLMDTEPVTTAVEHRPTPAQPEAQPAQAVTPTKKTNYVYTGVAVVLVVIALGAVWMRLESEGRVGTTFFSGILASQESTAVVATVNDETLRAEDLALSIQQLEQAAQTQGQNPQDPQVQADIRELAVDMLVNTTLLLQAAETAGVVITDAQVEERMAELEVDAGGAEVLMARMEEFGIDQQQFADDVRTELTIVTLLDSEFSEVDLSVTEEEVQALYEQAGGGQEGVPPLEEVRDQVEAQVRQTKEQAVVDAYIEELRLAADIEIVS